MADEISSLNDVREVANRMIAEDAQRDQMFQDLEAMVDGCWEGPDDETIRDAIDMSPHDTVMGIVNLMTGVRPQVRIPSDPQSSGSRDKANKLEKCLVAMQDAVDVARGMPLIVDSMYTAATFGTISYKVQSTDDMADVYRSKIEETKDGEEKARMTTALEEFNELKEATPFVVSALHPGSVHSIRSPRGLERVLEVRQMEASELWSEFGRHVAPDLKVGERLQYFEYWDRHQVMIWTDKSDTPIRDEKNNLGFLPYVIQYVHGSITAFGRAKIYPLLYSAWQGKTWDRMCLALTMITSNIMAMGRPSIAVEGGGMDAADLPLDLVGGRVNLATGGKIHFLNKDLDTEHMHNMYGLLSNLYEQGTLDRTIFGKPPEHVLAYSTVNLLVQGSRHQLSAPILLGGKALAELYRLQLRWIKKRNRTVSLYGDDGEVKLSGDMIPEGRLMIDVQLRPDLPQDRLQTGQLAGSLNERGIISREAALDLMGYSDPQAELKKILREEIDRAVQAYVIQRKIAEAGPALAQAAGIAGQPAEQPAMQPGQQPTGDLSGFIPPADPFQGGPPMVQEQGDAGLRQQTSAALGNEDLERAGLGDLEG